MKNRGAGKRTGSFLLAVFLLAGTLAGMFQTEVQAAEPEAGTDSLATAFASSEMKEASAEQVLAYSQKLDKLLRKMTEEDREYLTDVSAYRNYYQMTKTELNKIKKAVDKVCQSAVSEEERVQAVYQWITETIYYDYDYQEQEDQSLQSPYTVFQTGLAVGGGYAALFDLSLRLLDIPSLYLAGYGIEAENESQETKQDDINPEGAGLHAWNAAYVDGRWRYYDAAWDSGNSYRDGEKTEGEARRDYYGVKIGRMAEEHVPSALNPSAGGRFRVQGTGYIFDGSYSMEQLVITELPADMGTSYTVLSSLAGYPVTGFDSGVSASAAWSRIETLRFQKGITELPDYACLGMQALKKVVLPEGVKKIGKAAFADCASLKYIQMPSTLTSIEEEAFINCFKLNELTLPKGLKKIGNYAFSCSGLQSLTLPASVASIGQYALYGCRSLKTLKLSEGMKSIPTGMAKYCTALEQVTLPSGAEYIGKEAFYGCSSLPSVKLPDNIQTIYTYAFANCYSLKTVALGKKVDTITASAFYGSEMLGWLIGTGTKPPAVSAGFYLPAGARIQAPEGYGKVYEKAFGISAYVKKYKITVQEKKN